MEDLPEIMTVKQVANIMDWHPNTVYKLCTSGELKSFKVGNSRRVRKESFMEWIVGKEGESA